jgi:hypothetical protein
MCRLAGPTPGHVSYHSSRVIYVIKTNPAVIGGAPYGGCRLLKCSFTIPSRFHDAFEIRHKLVGFSAHPFTIANLDCYRDRATPALCEDGLFVSQRGHGINTHRAPRGDVAC